MMQQHFFNSDDVVWSRYWIGSNPKNAFVEYDYESVFAYNSRTLIDYVEQTIEVYGYDDVDNAFATQRKLQNIFRGQYNNHASRMVA